MPLTCRIKYTGILGMGFLGVVVLLDLYQLIADDSVSLPSYLQGFLVRGIALIGIPLVMNVALFYIHFSLTTKAGIHDGWLSPQMKAVMEVCLAQPHSRVCPRVFCCLCTHSIPYSL